MKKVKGLGIIDSIVLSNYILKNYGPMSHLKLQKLLFYAQAYHLGYFEEQLITDDFQAWVHGPVCRRIYDNLKDNSILYSDISFDEQANENPDQLFDALISSSQKELLSNILTELSSWTGLELESSTHQESPWIAARIGYSNADKCDKIISKESMKEFYSKEVSGW